MNILAYLISLGIGLMGISYLIAVVVYKTALYYMDKNNE
jgi:hypothetical protein